MSNFFSQNSFWRRSFSILSRNEPSDTSTDRGIISYILTRKPTQHEINDQIGNYLLLTPNLLDWNPHTNDYKDQDFGMLDYKGNIKLDKIEEFNESKRRIMALTIDWNFVDDTSYSVHLMHVLSKHDAAINCVQ